MRDRETLKSVFMNYAERYDTKNVMIHHKIEHTFRVAALSERYAQALGMGSDDAAWAWFFGLLHDIGRFEQVRRFGTFVDSQSVDHAELGADILFGDGLIEAFSVEEPAQAWMAMAEQVIRLHNKLTLPEALDERTRRFAEILRDADKTDIFRVIADIPFEARIGSSKASFAEVGEANPEVMACVAEHRCVPRQLRRSRFDGLIAHGCMAFELVFDVSRRTVKEEGWLRKLLSDADSSGKPVWTSREAEQLAVLRNEIEKAWGMPL